MKFLSLSHQWILFLLAFFVLTLLYVRFYYSPLPGPSEEKYAETVVEAVGEVANSGIQIFHEPPSLRQVLSKAGAFDEDSIRTTESLSELLTTGTLVTVKTDSSNGKRVILGRMEARKLLVFSIPFDLNQVSVGDLCLIPGLGEKLAYEIVTFREKRRGFRSVNQLREVKGIGDKKWQTLRTYFTVR